ncbi:MAG TPA: glycosyltransferase family 39 protein [bacterium]|nr:glycosyltransferase family 39 protein [bacterium]
MAISPRQALLSLLLFWVLAVALQWKGGAFRAEFGSHDDEPAHYVTGLMVRDYVAGFAPEPPLEYARRYYRHYPKVAFGHWPPVFYVAQAAWTLPFGASRGSMLLFLGLLSAGLAAALFAALRPSVGTAGAAAAAGVLLTLPLVQEYARVVMSDLLHGLLFFLAGLALAGYFRRPDWKWSAAFGAAAAAAVLNKGTGIALAALPLLMILLTRRFDVLLRPSFWLSAVVVAGAAAPWYLLAPAAMHQSAVPLSYVIVGPEFTPRFRTDWMFETGLWLLPPAAVGFWRTVVEPLLRGRTVEPLWGAAAALFLTTLGFRSITPLMADARHALPLVAPLVMFAAAGAAHVVRVLPGAVRWKAAGIAVVVLAAAAVNVQALPPKRPAGFIPVALDLLAEERLRDSAILIASDAIGEGMFIEEVAMHEERPGHMVLRASKVLSDSGWMGEGYTSFFDTPEQLMEYLDSVPVGVVVLEEDAAPNQSHQRVLRRVMTEFSDRWKPLGEYAGRGGLGPGTGIRVYGLVGHENRRVDESRLGGMPAGW